MPKKTRRWAAGLQATRFLPLLPPGQPWEENLHVAMRRNLDALRQAAAAGGMERGVLTRAARIADTDLRNLHRSLESIAARAQRYEALAARGILPVAGMDISRVAENFDAEGNLRSVTVRQGLPPDSVDPGETLPGFAYRRISTLYGADGTKTAEWKIQSPRERERWKEVAALLEKRAAAIRPLPPVALPPRLGPAEFLNQVTIADGHVGALAWRPETGSANWDLKIARETLLTGACWLADNLPAAEELLLVILGDFLDFDGFAPLTPQSKHLLDVDARFPKVADVAAEIIEAVATHALGRYARVRLLIKPGNHDPLSAWWLRKYFGRVFGAERRVTVEGSMRPYWAMNFGRNMIATHHGDFAKLEQLPGIFAADFAEQWGRATHRFCHTGHLHHRRMLLNTGKEHAGMMVFQHPTAASRNAWAANLGLSAARELLGHTYRAAGGMETTLHFSADSMDAAA